MAYEDKDLNPRTGSMMPNHTKTHIMNFFEPWEEPQDPRVSVLAIQPEASRKFSNEFVSVTIDNTLIVCKHIKYLCMLIG